MVERHSEYVRANSTGARNPAAAHSAADTWKHKLDGLTSPTMSSCLRYINPVVISLHGKQPLSKL